MQLVSPQELFQLNNLELIAKQVVEGFIIGLHQSPFHGFSVEFAEHRQYNPGETIKHVDWKVYGRTDKMFTKKYEEETNLRCQIVIDTSSSMFYPDQKVLDETDKINKAQFAAMSASSLMYLLKKQRDAVGLSLFNDHVEIHTKTRSTTVHHRLLMKNLHDMLENPNTHRKTKAAECLHQIAENVHKRSLVVILSDMLDNASTDQNQMDEIFSALQHLRYNKHEVVLFHVVDKSKEIDFDFNNRPYLFVDMETGEKIKLQAGHVKDHYIKQMDAFRKQLKLKCGQFQIDFVDADIHEGFNQVLQTYLLKRQKMRT